MIGPQLATFLEQGLSIHIGTRDERLAPLGARAAALVIDPDQQHLTVYVAEIAAARLMANLRTNGQIAVGVARPEDDRACQVKGTVIDIRPAPSEAHPVVMRQWRGFMAQLEKIGIPAAVADGWAHWPAVAIRTRVTAVYEQTPGPQAGSAIT